MALAGILFWFLVRTMKFHFVSEVLYPNLFRHLWYSYYLPMMFIPLYTAFVALSMGKPEDYRLPGWKFLLGIPTAVLFLLVIFNDFHQMYAVTIELCIQCGLIQANTHYKELFDASTVGAQILDEKQQVCLTSQTSRPMEEDLTPLLDPKEIWLTFGESIEKLEMYGVTCGLDVKVTSPVLGIHLMTMYDFLEEIIERSQDCMTTLIACVIEKDDGYWFTINTDAPSCICNDRKRFTKSSGIT